MVAGSVYAASISAMESPTTDRVRSASLGLYVTGQLGVVFQLLRRQHSRQHHFRDGNPPASPSTTGRSSTPALAITPTLPSGAATYAENPGDSDRPFRQSTTRSGTLGPVTTNGNGGVIGTRFIFGNMGPITVNGGFGAINDSFETVGAGHTGGYHRRRLRHSRHHLLRRRLRSEPSMPAAMARIPQ